MFMCPVLVIIAILFSIRKNVLNLYVSKLLCFLLQILQVLSVPSKQLFSYPLRPGMTLADLQTMLEVETKIPIADQEILLASGAEAVGEPSRWASEGVSTVTS